MSKMGSSLKRHWNTTVTIQSPTYAIDAYGGQSVSTWATIASNVRASIQQRSGALVVEGKRDSITYDAVCYIDSTYTIIEGSKATDGNSNLYTIIAVSDQAGLAEFTRLTLKRASA